MKKFGWILIIIGSLSLLGAILKGHNAFGPLLWIGAGTTIIYIKNEREKNNKTNV